MIGPIEELTALTGVEFISDLHTMPYAIIRSQLRNMNPDAYTLEQWKDASKYLTGEATELGTVNEIYDFLLLFSR